MRYFLIALIIFFGLFAHRLVTNRRFGLRELLAFGLGAYIGAAVVLVLV